MTLCGATLIGGGSLLCLDSRAEIVTTLVSPYILRVAEGVYFTSAAYLHKSINGVKDSNDRLAAYFAAICECNCEQSKIDHK